jgi:MoaA/NifB/PqqE/SkfB family radical SAM enzyme
VGADAILEVARALARQRVPIVILGGGEPLGRFQRALEIVRILAHASEVRLATSGAGLTPARAAALRDAGLGVLAISLDGADRGRVDRVRGAGAYDTATRALGVAAEAGLPTLVTCVVGRESLPEEADVEKFLALVRSLHQGAAVGFLPEFAAGRGSGFRNPAAYRTTGARISRAIRRGRHRAATFYGAPMDQLVGCVGQRQLVVDIEGNLGACVSGCSFGNVVREPFDAVWARMLATLTRFKQGWFCAHPGDAPADEALRAFHAETEDAWLQRAVDGLGPILPWLVPG